MSNTANEVYFENLKDKILDTNLIDLVWKIWDANDKDAKRDAEKLEAIAFSNEDLFIDYFDGFISFPRITTGEFLDFLEEMAEAKHLPNRNREKVIAGLKIDINEVYEILARESDKRFEEGASNA
jgi:hypothetical protein